MLAEPEVIEALAQRFAARLVAARSDPATTNTSVTPETTFAVVDVASLQLIRPRSVGVEAVGLAAIGWLGIDPILQDLGFNTVQRAAVAASLIGRMAVPGSELATWRWLRGRSALGELLDVDFEAMPLMRLYRVSDLLVRCLISPTPISRAPPPPIRAPPAASKEKRSDCLLVTLGLVLDASGFVRRSRMFAGNIAAAGTLSDMLKDLAAPPGALVIVDAGIATEATIAWLQQHKYRYLVVSRERTRQFDPDQAVDTLTAAREKISLQRVVNEDGTEVRLYCHSERRQTKETALSDRFVKRFETGLAALAAGLSKPRAQKTLAAIQQRIGRLKEKSRGFGQHYEITVTPEETGTKAAAITWVKIPRIGSMLTHPGVYCLRSNETTWDAPTLWRTYTMLTDLEAVFRSLKSELGRRPVFHQKEARTEGHLFITVLAYQMVQAVRRKLDEAGGQRNLASHPGVASWAGLPETLAVQQRITTTFRQRDGRTLHVRKATVAEPTLRKIYDALGIDAAPGGVQKHTV